LPIVFPKVWETDPENWDTTLWTITFRWALKVSLTVIKTNTIVAGAQMGYISPDSEILEVIQIPMTSFGVMAIRASQPRRLARIRKRAQLWKRFKRGHFGARRLEHGIRRLWRNPALSR